MSSRSLIFGLIGLATLLLLNVGCKRSESQTVCGFCQRLLRPQTRTVAEIGGRRANVCCPRCAITEAFQEHKPVRLISVSDYPTQKPISPETAFYVDGSRAIACDHGAAPMDETKAMPHLTFDRCSPGTFAFAHREDADVFVANNGGVVHTFQQLMEGVPHD
jgi:hypothetical protein